MASPIDLSRTPARLLVPGHKNGGSRVDIITTVYDAGRGKFMALVRLHETGALRSVEADSLVTGSAGANLTE